MGILDGIPKNLIDGFKNVVNWRNNITAVREARLGKYGNRGLVAVGIPVARYPPHRSVRAELPHTAPASGHDANRADG